MKIPFLHKYYGGSYIGGFLDTYGRAAMVINGLQFIVVLVIFYTTSAKPYIIQYAPWFTFTHYLLLVFFALVLLIVLTRLFVVPSAYTFTNQQVWENTNPMRDKLEEIEKTQTIIQNNQKMIMEKLGIDEVKPE